MIEVVGQSNIGISLQFKLLLANEQIIFFNGLLLGEF